LNIRSVFNNKSNTHQAFWLAVGNLSSFALTIISAAILSRYFDKTEYGTYRQILYIYNTLLVIFTAGLPRVFSFYLPRFSQAQGKDIVLKISRILFFTGLLFSLFLFLFADFISEILKNPELSRGLKFFSPIPMFLLPTLGIEGIFSTYRKTIFIAIYNTLSRILMLIFIVVPVILFKGTYLYAIYGWIAVSVITFGIASYFKSIPFNGIPREKSDLSLREILHYSLPIAFASLAGIAIKSADQFYISRYFGTETFAEFSNGFIQLPFVGMITGATATVLMPVFSKIIHDKSDVNKLTSLWQSTLQKSAIIIYPLVLFFIFFAKEVIIVLYSVKYSSSHIYFIIAMAINFFNIIVFAPLLLSLGETKFYARLHLFFACTAWGIGYLVVLIFKNPVAVAIFSALQSILIIIVALLFTSKRVNTNYFQLFPARQLFKITIHSLLSILAVKTAEMILPIQMSNFTTLVISSICFILILLITSPIFKIDYGSIIKPLLQSRV
jgi:O-antigen/teichoic acid export membrane protein